MPLVRAETLGYVTAEPTDAAKPLVIPVSAALLTGTRAIVYVQIPDAEEPTYDGREVVLGPRAGDFYLIKSGLQEGELVVTNGNFKLDSALQISAKPSMMTPEGGGGGGMHHHGGESNSKAGDEAGQMAGHTMSLPSQLKQPLHQTAEIVDEISTAIESAELDSIRAAFAQLEQSVASLNANQLKGDMQAQLDEFTMLLRNDAVEGQDVQSLSDADRVYLATKEHSERLKTMFGLSHGAHQMAPESLDVPDVFRQELSSIISPYLAIGKALAADNPNTAAEAANNLQQVVEAVSGQSLSGKAAERWAVERASLSKVVARLGNANDLPDLRSAFALLSDELLTLYRTFGLPSSQSLFELHCPMAFDGRGASWLQADKQVRNPYYGASMLKCADRVERL
jgi:Cu(I)/Ag(I) efflux system membrane fusion protein